MRYPCDEVFEVAVLVVLLAVVVFLDGFIVLLFKL